MDIFEIRNLSAEIRNLSPRGNTVEILIENMSMILNQVIQNMSMIWNKCSEHIGVGTSPLRTQQLELNSIRARARRGLTAVCSQVCSRGLSHETTEKGGLASQLTVWERMVCFRRAVHWRQETSLAQRDSVSALFLMDEGKSLRDSVQPREVSRCALAGRSVETRLWPRQMPAWSGCR